MLVTFDTQQVTCDRWHMTRDTWEVICDMWKVTHDIFLKTYFDLDCYYAHTPRDSLSLVCWIFLIDNAVPNTFKWFFLNYTYCWFLMVPDDCWRFLMFFLVFFLVFHGSSYSLIFSLSWFIIVLHCFQESLWYWMVLNILNGFL